MLLDDVLDGLVAQVKEAREAQSRASTIEETAMWRNWADGYVEAVIDIYGHGAALRIERRLAGREDDETG
jgi:hypothetical protein